MDEIKKIDTVFSDSHLPWLLNKNYRFDSDDISKSTVIEFEKIGRVLACHLFIEHYLTKFIELRTPVLFDWDESKLTFSQKLKLVKKAMLSSGMSPFYKGIETINRIRNKFSHNINASISPKDINEVKAGLEAHFKSLKSEPSDKYDYSDLATIELFTSIFCAYVHGYTTSLAKFTHP